MSLSLTDRQRADLNCAILDYLICQGDKFAESVQIFKKESGIDSLSEQGKAMLEKKWTSVIRLQKRVMDLEAKVESLQSIKGGDGTVFREIGENSKALPKAPAKFSLSGHRGPITAVACHPKYTLIASSSEDSSIKIWDHESGQYEATMKGHTGVVTGLSFDPQGKLLASSANDMCAKLWDMSNYSCIKTLKGHDHTVSAVKFLPSGDHLFTCSRDETIKYWDVTTGYCLKTYNGHSDWVKCLSISLDGLYLASGGFDNNVIIWAIGSGQMVQTLRGHEHNIEAIVYGKKPLDVDALIASSSSTTVTTTTVLKAENGEVTKGSKDTTVSRFIYLSFIQYSME